MSANTAKDGKVWTPPNANRWVRPSSVMTWVFVLAIVILASGILTMVTVSVFKLSASSSLSETTDGLQVGTTVAKDAALESVKSFALTQPDLYYPADDVKDVVLDDYSNGSTGFIILKDNSIVPFTVTNRENLITVSPDTEYSMKTSSAVSE